MSHCSTCTCILEKAPPCAKILTTQAYQWLVKLIEDTCTQLCRFGEPGKFRSHMHILEIWAQTHISKINESLLRVNILTHSYSAEWKHLRSLTFVEYIYLLISIVCGGGIGGFIGYIL